MTWKDLIAPDFGLLRLFARGVWHVAGAVENKGFDDPVYKKNLQRLMERDKEFEDARRFKEERNEPHS